MSLTPFTFRQSVAPAQPLPQGPDPAILRIVRALARQAAREDHARETAERASGE